MIFIFPVFVLFSVIFFLYGYGNKIKRLTNTIKWIWIIGIAGVFSIILLDTIIHFFTDKTNLEKNDIFGQYVIDRNMFKGPNTDWQYNHFRFEITKNGSFYFYVTDQEKVYKTFRGTVEFLDGYHYRIKIHPESKSDLIDTIPALYRKTFSFYYVMSHTPYGNTFYKKGEWKPIN